MDFGYTPKVEALRERVHAFMDAHIVPRIRQWNDEVHAGQYPVSFMEELKERAKAEGLWNLFLPHLKDDEPGTGLTNLEYAPLAEIMGRVSWASEVFNCNAPDTGNMELLHMFATPEQREQWLLPLLRGEIRSAFAMTEPDVASSDATNITTRIRRDGDDYVIDGRKWFITNAAHPNCKIFIVMGKTDPDAESHQQQSMILVPRDTPGVTIVRNITVVNHHAPEGHCEITFDNVRVPARNLLGEEGSGFALAQARLGPGRIGRRMDRALAHRDRPGAPAGAEGRVDDRQGRRKGRTQGNLDDQGARADRVHGRMRPRDAGVRRDGLEPRHAARRHVDLGPRAALRRRPGRGAPAGDRAHGDQGRRARLDRAVPDAAAARLSVAPRRAGAAWTNRWCTP